MVPANKRACSRPSAQTSLGHFLFSIEQLQSFSIIPMHSERQGLLSGLHVVLTGCVKCRRTTMILSG